MATLVEAETGWKDAVSESNCQTNLVITANSNKDKRNEKYFIH